MTDPGVEARRIAIDAIERILSGGAYANLLVPNMLSEADLEVRDRGFVTELVYGTTRMRRALDFLVDRFVMRVDIEPRVRAALQVGAYQLAYLETPPHAAVDTTVAATPKRARGFVNAILRKVASAGTAAETSWPTDAIRLSYPDWIVDRLRTDVGERSLTVLEAMNQPARVHMRADGYRQDPASQAVAQLIDARAGQVIVDLCAAPGGKATLIGGSGAVVIGVDVHEHRATLVRTAAETTGTAVHPVVADGTRNPFRHGSVDHALVDAPCSGLGSLRRRPDARWRMEADRVPLLADLQFDLVRAAAELVKPGGQVTYSVCTLTTAESTDVDDRIERELPELQPAPLPGAWEPLGRGGRLLPDTFDGDGMSAFSFRLQ